MPEWPAAEVTPQPFDDTVFSPAPAELAEEREAEEFVQRRPGRGPLLLLLAFVLPLALLALGRHDPALLGITFILQYLGLLAERWFFFAQANHPQNLYYQTIG